MSIYCDGMVHVVELHVEVNMFPGEGGQRRFMRPIAVFNNDKEALEKVKNLLSPELIELAKEILQEDGEWRFLTGNLKWARLNAHVEDDCVEYYDDVYEHDSIIDSITIGFSRFEVPVNPAEL